MQKAVIPGKPAIERICAQKGTVGEEILRRIANPQSQPQYNRREFGCWTTLADEAEGEVCGGTVVTNGSRIPILLQVGPPSDKRKWRTLFIEEVPGKRLSLKPTQNGNGNSALTLRIGNVVNESQLNCLASQIVATFLVHGFGWRNRHGKVVQQPYGEDADKNSPGRQRRKSRQRVRRENHDRHRGLW